MTVAYLVNQYPMPTQTFIRREILALERLGVKVDRYSLRRWDGTLVDPGDIAEAKRTRSILETGALPILWITVKTLLTRPAPFFRALAMASRIGRRSGKGVLLHWVYLAEACVLRKWLAETDATHVHAHFGTNSAMVAMLCRLLGGPSYSYTCHGPGEYDRPWGLGLTEKTQHSAFVVGISRFGASQLYRWARYADWPKVQVVRCGVDEMFLHADPPPPPDAPVLVNVARLGHEKGQLILLTALRRLRDAGTNVQVKLVGDGELRREIEQVIDELKLRDCVSITGWVSNDAVRQEILAARALVLPSFAEGLPLVVMEALALHRPIVGTYIAGMPELVAGDCGWLVPAGSVEEMAAAIRQALEATPQKLAEMGRAGAARVAEMHDVNREAARLAALFAQPPALESRA